MSRTRVYTVHIRAWAASADRDAVFLREGFSWGAFVFSFLWALWHRLWFAALIFLGVSFVLMLLPEFVSLDPFTDTAIAAAAALLIGWHGNDFRRRALERQGYVTAGVVAAPNLIEAERRFFEKRAAAGRPA